MGESPQLEAGAGAAFSGRVVRKKGDEVIVEIDVHEEGEWRVEEDVEIVDGRRARGEGEGGAGAHDGRWARGGGADARLVLTIAAGETVELEGARVRMGAVEVVIVESVV